MSITSTAYLRQLTYFDKNVVLNPDVEYHNRTVTYWDLEQYLLTKNETIALNELHKLYSDVKKLLKNINPNAVNDATMEIILMFLNEKQFLNKHHNNLKTKFGEFNCNITKSIVMVVNEFKDALSTDGLKFLNTTMSVEPNGVRFKLPNIYVTSCDLRQKIQNWRSNDVNSIPAVKNFSMLYTEKNTKSATSTKKAEDVFKLLIQYNTTSFSDEQFCDNIIEILLAAKDFRKQLYSYMGYDHYELHEFLRKNKLKIFQNCSSVDTKPNNQLQPSYGTQVVVQSKQEKDLLKMLKKVEKKKKLGQNDEYERKYTDIKVQHMKASSDTILTKYSGSNTAYRNVYDNKLNHRVQVPIMTGYNKVDKGSYEEVVVEPQPRSNMPVIPKLVFVEKLDHIGQIVFRDIKNLNIVQTIVFSVAYSTNENMLICAPTGAGKTNIALLTIVNQIKQCTTNGVIDHSQFKIVYIAPMKALAAEVTEKFTAKLGPLGVVVKELTGDMQLSPNEIKSTQVLVTTPEKWDVVTRKGTGDNGITKYLKLMIIDEVHLLQGDRGPVIEALVARTKRLVEFSQSMIRIIALSATLPNYMDVARFLSVNLDIGLFFFDNRFRPVPLKQIFIGVKPVNSFQIVIEMDNACYDKVIEFVQNGHQCMVFVHARGMTVHTAKTLKEKAMQADQLKLFTPSGRRPDAKCWNRALDELIRHGFGVHHAGLDRRDRNLVEKYFKDGIIKVLVCTSTLAWGVNLPAHGVIIKGTDFYNSKQGAKVPLDILDVLQIFGRAGRPQFDTSGTGVIITTHDMLSHYLKLLTHPIPIESRFLNRLADHLNAEIVLGSVMNVQEAITWMGYTYLEQRLKTNPLVYGLDYDTVQKDPTLYEPRRKFVHMAAMYLDKAKMIRYNSETEDFAPTDLGRTASYYYINFDTIEMFNNCIKSFMGEKQIFDMIAQADEFTQLQLRREEIQDLDMLLTEYCQYLITDGASSVRGKINILMQTYLSRGIILNPSLVSDMAFITQNVVRICRALFDIVLHQNNPTMAGQFLMFAQMFEVQMWHFGSPFRQFKILSFDIIEQLERYDFTVERVRDENLETIFRSSRTAELLKKCAHEFPLIEAESFMQPITRSVLRVKMTIKPNFKWNDDVHGKYSEAYWLWIEDPDNNTIYYYEHFSITKFNVFNNDTIELAFTVPLIEPIPSQYLARITSDRWLCCILIHPLSFRELVLPESYPPHTDLLELQPLPVSVLKNKNYEALYKFSHFNPIQTQIFHCLYHTDYNTLVGAPTGSGKTIISELAVLRMFNHYPDQKVVYIAPLKALVRERVADWKERFEKRLGKIVVELTGDVSPNIRKILGSNIIITTPEKWDGLSRNWQSRIYVKQVGLIIIDEIHLLGEERGPVLEVIVSRTKYIAANTSKKLRIVGLSTAMANARDLANWLGIEEIGLYNFRPSVRPVPLEVHIAGYPGRHYCPRMISMNKPTYQAIKIHAPDSPTLIFVSSRRQTRLTALDLMSYLATDTDQRTWLHMNEYDMTAIVSMVKDESLKQCLPYGIGIHHAGLQDRDRKITEELFINQKIQVLVATSTLAWGVNFPAHLVVVKGTEFFDSKQKRYVDIPITDVLQMMGRAGRPQFDTSGVAVVLVHDIKKNFYKKFLYEPFPVESFLLEVLPDHINAEVVAGTVQNKEDLLKYLSWTYFYQRLMQNPLYYNLPSLEPEEVHKYLDELSDATLRRLVESHCIEFTEEKNCYTPTPLGTIASYYYLSNETMRYFHDNLNQFYSIDDLLLILSRAHEFSEVPVRHNEDHVNSDLAKNCRLPSEEFDSPYTKTFLLLQCHFSRLQMPVSDYTTDLKAILDQAVRIIQSMIDVAVSQKWLSCALRIQQLLQMIIQACWIDDSPFLQLFDFDKVTLDKILCNWSSLFPNHCEDTLFGIKAAYISDSESFKDFLDSVCGKRCVSKVTHVLDIVPIFSLNISIKDYFDDNINSIKRDNFGELYTSVHINCKCTFIISIKRIGKKLTVPARYFSKSKDEMWFLNLGYSITDELIAFERISIHGSNTYKMEFMAPKIAGTYNLSLYLMSDSYIGLDQQYNIIMKVLN